MLLGLVTFTNVIFVLSESVIVVLPCAVDVDFGACP